MTLKSTAIPDPAGGVNVDRQATVAVVLMTKNEETRLAACLDHVVDWADEIVIIDDCSTDRHAGTQDGHQRHSRR
jgi:hypothetical protein